MKRHTHLALAIVSAFCASISLAAPNESNARPTKAAGGAAGFLLNAPGAAAQGAELDAKPTAPATRYSGPVRDDSLRAGPKNGTAPQALRAPSGPVIKPRPGGSRFVLNVPGTYPTIQAAINAAGPGDTINVYPGNYNETAAGSFLFDASGPYQFGLFISASKPGLTIRGVDGGGSPITSAAAVQAHITTNATNNFGYSGTFIEADNVTITGLEFGSNAAGTNKTIEVIGDNLAIKYCLFTDHEDPWGGGSLYIDDWRFDVGMDTSHIQSYLIDGCKFLYGMSIDIASGAGYSGPVAGRQIVNSFFDLFYGPADVTWPGISFNGANTGVPWFVQSVGGAIITGNTFSNADVQYIRARGDYDNTQYNWNSYWNNNTFDRAVVFGAAPPANLGTYSYPNGYGTFNNVRRIGATIQQEVDHASAGQTVLVAHGTYEEQVVVSTSNLTIKGSGSGGNPAVDSIVESPVSLPYFFVSAGPNNNHPIIGVHDCTGVTIRDLRVDGAGRGNGNYRFQGIAYWNAGGTIDGCDVRGIRETPLSGNQHGVGIYANHNAGGPYALDVLDTTVSDYQKNGIVLADVTSNVIGCTVTGSGPLGLGLPAQNGIQASSGADVLIMDCTVSDHQYTPATYAACGVLVLDSATTASILDNEIVDNMPGVYLYDTSACSIGDNSITNALGFGYPDAIDIVRDAVYLASSSGGPKARPQAMDGDSSNSDGSRALLTVYVFGNTLMGADAANTGGVYAYSGAGAVNVSALQNKVRDWDYGFYAQEVGAGTVSFTAHNNVIVSNVTDGFFATGPTVQDAENNFWGDATGPKDLLGTDEADSPPCFAAATMKNSNGTGDAVSDLYVDYCPWKAGNGFLTLEATDTCIQNGQTQITVQLWMRNVATPVTGYQAFVSFDDSRLSLNAAASSYNNLPTIPASPFPLHVRTFTPNTVQTGVGQLSLDGSRSFFAPGITGDALLATLVFDVDAGGWAQCETTVVEFFDNPPFYTELSFQGSPVPTCRTESPALHYDTVAPVISGCTATGGNVDNSCQATVTFSASVADNCCLNAANVSAAVSLTSGNATLGTPSITISQVDATHVSVSGSVVVSSLTSCPAVVQVVVSGTDCCGNAGTSCTVTADVYDVTPPVIVCPPNATIQCNQPTDPADVGVVVSMPFDSNPTLSPTQAPGVWYTDRYNPFGFTMANFGGGNRLKHSIDASDCQSCRPGGYSSGFYNTQGRKYDIGSTTSMKIDLYVPAAWAGTGQRMAGFWGTAFDGSNAISAYPIVEFTSDGGTPRFRGWDSDPGSWIDMGLPMGFAYDAWYTLHIDLVGSNFVYKVGNLTLNVPAYGSVKIGNVILQGHNSLTGITYDIYWDNFVASQLTIATDNCDPAPTIWHVDVPALTGCDGTGTITRTWHAKDACDNESTCTQVITVVDTTPPTITYCPPETTIQCSTPPTPANTGGPATATDICDPSPAVTYTDVPALGGCNGTGSITRTWHAKDACNNEATCTQVIHVVDTTPPSITCPPNVTIQCSDSTVPGIPFGTATGGIMIYYKPGPEEPANQAYYKAQVGYGNTNGAPFAFSNVPLTGFGPLTWSNLFGQVAPPTQFGFDVELMAPGGTPPPGLIAYENTNNSAAGRAAAGAVLWKIGDYKDGAPNGPGNAANVDINSLFRSPSPGNPLTDVVITQFVVTHPSTNVWVAQVGGKLKADNFIHWYNPLTPNTAMAAFNLNGDIYFSGTLTYDTTLDTIDGQDFYAGTITFTANSPNAALGFALATDNCTQFPAVTYSDVFTPGGLCPPITGTIARTWKATDACGNMNTCVQTITVVDTVAPVITCPPNVTIECGASTLPANTGSATAVDNCDATVVPTYSDSSAGTCPQVITRTWTATDDCGNFSTCVQTITVQDTTAPTISPPAANQTVECDGSGNAAQLAAWLANHGGASASDVCSAVTWSYSPATPVLSDLCGATGAVTVTFRATDVCGNYSETTATFTVTDTVPPVFTTCPLPPINVNADPGSCSASAATVNLTTPTANDTCSGPATVTGQRSDFPLTLADPYPQGVTTITWTATDACGLQSTCDQTVNVSGMNNFEIPVQYVGLNALSLSVAERTRCVRFILKDASTCNVVTISTPVILSGNPASGTAFFSAACSSSGWLEICGKDEQHTLSDKKPLTTAGLPPHYTCATLLLRSGDTDNDNDVDINDVTLLLAQWGLVQPLGTCAWNGVRSGDFSLEGPVGIEDYQFVSDNWLQFRNCCNPFGWPITGPSGPSGGDASSITMVGSEAPVGVSINTSQLSPDVAALADLNSDGVVDYRDVEVFEARMGLPNDLSAKMRSVHQPIDSSMAPGTAGEE